MTPRRPAVRYHGGKWVIAPRIIALLPPHKVYVEPYGGGGSVLVRKPRVGHEVYNDLSGEMVNLFRVLRDQGEELRRKILLTPFSRTEYEASKERSENPVEQARRTLVRSFMGHGSNSTFGLSGFRAKSQRNNTGAAVDWANFPDKLPPLIERLRGVVIEQRDAIELIQQHDGPDVCFYLDPPYLPETRGRSRRKVYDVGMDEAGHLRLAKVLQGLQGAAVVSGYPSPLYDELYAGWWREELEGASCHNRKGEKPVEVLWMNREPVRQVSLFEMREEL